MADRLTEMVRYYEARRDRKRLIKSTEEKLAFVRWAQKRGYKRVKRKSEHEALRMEHATNPPVIIYYHGRWSGFTVPVGLAEDLVREWMGSRDDVR